MRRAAAITLLTLILVAATAAAASPVPRTPGTPGGSDGLLADLAWVPATASVRDGLVSWVDYRAVEAARPGAAHPGSFAELQAGFDADDPAAARWMAALTGVASGSGDLVRTAFQAGVRWPEVVGFDLLDVDRELAFGMPPANGLVLAGRFDPEAIGAALGARGFTGTPAGDIALWCGPAGCDHGLDIDLADQEPADPFGGRLGRRQPLAVSPTTLLSSAALDTIEGMLDAGSDGAASLADDPRWSAAARALGAEGTLIQATFVPGSELRIDPAMILARDPDVADLRAWLDELRAAGFEPMPAATRLAIGDAATGAEQVVTLALTYPTLADAQAAAAALPSRLEQMRSLRAATPWRELLDERGVTSIDADAHSTAGGGGVATLTLRAPLADEPGELGRLPASSQLYRMFVQSVFARDIGWLAPDLPDLE